MLRGPVHPLYNISYKPLIVAPSEEKEPEPKPEPVDEPATEEEAELEEDDSDDEPLDVTPTEP